MSGKQAAKDKMDVIDRTLSFAQREDRPVIVVYQGKKGLTQRRVYVRGISEDKVTVYCTQKRGIRVFARNGILAAMLAEEQER